MQAANSDRELYFKHNRDGKLVLLLSLHVDDLKITGESSEIDSVLKLLTDNFDELKLATDNFEHLGLKHSLETDGSRTMSQEHYIAELRYIPADGCKGMMIQFFQNSRWCCLDSPNPSRYSSVHSSLAEKVTESKWEGCHELEPGVSIPQKKAFKIYFPKSKESLAPVCDIR